MTFQFLSHLKTSALHVLVMGAGRSGIAATKLLLKHGHRVTLTDDHPVEKLRYLSASGLLADERCSFSFQKAPVADVAGIIVSPGIAPTHPLLVKARTDAIPIVSEIDLGTAYCTPAKIIGITGTNGKSTTTVMIQTILNAAGFNAQACGNLGRPFCDVVLENDHSVDFFVIELSSFQLEASFALRLHGAIIVNITPDHLDRHASFAEYRDTKLKIATLRHDNAPLVAQHDVLGHTNVHYFSGRHYGEGDFSFLSRIPMRGFHNQENAMAAALIARCLGIDDRSIARGLSEFKALPHRCEIVLHHNDLLFINDSKGTTVEAVKKALESFSQPVHLLLGGIAKGEDFGALHQSAYPHVKGYYVYGRDQHKIVEDLRSRSAHAFRDLAEAMRAAVACAHKGDAILLSPGCASYDQFDDYLHRGETFKQLARQIMDASCELS